MPFFDGKMTVPKYSARRAACGRTPSHSRPAESFFTLRQRDGGRMSTVPTRTAGMGAAAPTGSADRGSAAPAGSTGRRAAALACAALFAFFSFFLPADGATPLPPSWLPTPVSAQAAVPWKHEYRLRGDEAFQTHCRKIIESGITAPSGLGEVYYADPSDDVQGMVNSLEPGDTLYLRGGVYHRKIRLYGGVQGREDAYITIAAMPGEDVVIDGSGIGGGDIDQDGPAMFLLYGCSYVQLSGFRVQDAHGRDASAVLIEPGSHHIVVSDFYIRDIRTPSPESEDHCANAILIMGRSGNTISDVLLFRNSIEDCETGWSEAIAVSANVSRVNIVGNRLDDTGNIAICFSGNYGNAPSDVDFPRDGLVFGNIITNCHCVYDTGFAIYADGARDVDFVSNIVKNCDGGVEAGAEEGGHSTRDILIAGNLLTDCAEAAVGIGTPGGGGHVESVTVYGNRYRHVGWLSGGASILRFGSSDISTHDNAYIGDDGEMDLPFFPALAPPAVH